MEGFSPDDPREAGEDLPTHAAVRTACAIFS